MEKPQLPYSCGFPFLSIRKGRNLDLYSIERTHDSNESVAHVLEWIGSRKFCHHFEICDDGHLTSHCVLFDSHRREVSRGSGKGINHKVGALAEAIEHYYLHLEIEKTHEWTTVREIVKQKDLSSDGDVYFSGLDPKSKIRIVFFENDEGDSVKVPLALVNPFSSPLNTAESILNKYSTNSGCAAGTIKQDSVLHGLNEVIERHDQSRLFLDLTYREKKLLTDWFRVDPKSECLQSKEVNNIITICRKNEFDTWTAFSWTDSLPVGYEMVPMGGGSSISSELAIQRSIDELTQQLTIPIQTEDCAQDHCALDIFSDFSKLQVLIDFDGIEFSIFDARQVTDSYYLNSLTPLEMLVKITATLKQNGKNVLKRTLFGEKNFFITQVFSPGLDRFNLIRNGCLVASQLV